MVHRPRSCALVELIPLQAEDVPDIQRLRGDEVALQGQPVLVASEHHPDWLDTPRSEKSAAGQAAHPRRPAVVISDGDRPREAADGLSAPEEGAKSSGGRRGNFAGNDKAAGEEVGGEAAYCSWLCRDP
jgi:hypothetical protein